MSTATLLWALSAGTATFAQQPQDGSLVYESERIDFSAATPVRGRTRKGMSRKQEVSDHDRSAALTPMVQPQARPLESIASDRSAYSPIRQTGYADQNSGWIDGGYGEVTCGCEGPCDCGMGCDPGCGLEAPCGMGACGGTSCGCGATGCDTLGCDGCCDGMDPSCGCGACCGAMGYAGGLIPRMKFQWYEWDVFAGVAGFTGPMNFADTNLEGTDRDGAASFGFYEGFNRGRPLDFLGTDLATQWGARFTQANLSGAEFSDDTRQQVFLTGGFFRRVDCGLQYGLVFDYLYEDWYYRSELTQLRGELSWVFRGAKSVGFRFASGIDDDKSRTSVIDDAGATIGRDVATEAINQYRLFYRQHLARSGMCQAFVGWTDTDDALLGVNADLPLRHNLLWNTSATYLVPNQGTGGHLEEGWNLSIGFTYRPCGLGSRWRHNRPLFNIADNGSMITGRK